MKRENQENHVNQEQFYTARGYQLMKRHKNELTPSLEDYLEMICRSFLEEGGTKVKLLANDLNVKPPSASRMLRRLAQLGLVDYEPYGKVQLTEEGRQLGEYLLWRHEVVHRFFELISFGDTERTFEETEMAEHIFSRETVIRLEKVVCLFVRHPNLSVLLRQMGEETKPE